MRTTYTGLVDQKYLDQIVTLTGWCTVAAITAA